MGRRRADRQALLDAARLHHILASISGLYYPLSHSRWQGDDERGGYEYDNGQGDNYTIVWRPPGPSVTASRRGPLIALVFAHESERSEYDKDEDERQPLRQLPGLPAELEVLAQPSPNREGSRRFTSLRRKARQKWCRRCSTRARIPWPKTTAA